MLLVRRRPVDFKFAKLRHFGNVDRQDELIGMTKDDFSDEDVAACKSFSIFFVPGKNLEIVLIVLTPLMRQVLEALIKHRTYMNITGDTLFTHSNERPVQPTEFEINKKKTNQTEKTKPYDWEWFATPSRDF